jgi:hypothetical protein
MGLFDWIPTVDEVIEFVDCRLTGHAWTIYYDGNVPEFRICRQCNKREKL